MAVHGPVRFVCEYRNGGNVDGRAHVLVAGLVEDQLRRAGIFAQHGGVLLGSKPHAGSGMHQVRHPHQGFFHRRRIQQIHLAPGNPLGHSRIQSAVRLVAAGLPSVKPHDLVPTLGLGRFRQQVRSHRA